MSQTPRKPAGLQVSLAMVLVLPLAACAVAPAPTPLALATPVVRAIEIPPMPPALEAADTSNALTGFASWYRTGRHLHTTCNGERLSNNALTAAATEIPVGSVVRVTRLDNGSSVVVRINDCMPRGPHVIDLTLAAAAQLDMVSAGSVKVSISAATAETELASRQ